jgi:hypothetical protein
MRSSAPDAAVLLRQIARNATDEFVSVKEAITLVHRALSKRLPGMKVSRVEDIWRGEARLIRAEEMDAIRAEADAILQKEAQHAYREVREDIRRLEALVLAIEDQIGADHQPAFACAGPSHRTLAR